MSNLDCSENMDAAGNLVETTETGFGVYPATARTMADNLTDTA